MPTHAAPPHERDLEIDMSRVSWHRNGPHDEVRLEIPSDVDMVHLAEGACEQIARTCQMDASATQDLSLAVRECVMNAIIHGNQEVRRRRVIIGFAIDRRRAPKRLVVTVQDEGQGFSLGAIPDPRSPENRLKLGGRGVLFMRAFMDEVHTLA